MKIKMGYGITSKKSLVELYRHNSTRRKSLNRIGKNLMADFDGYTSLCGLGEVRELANDVHTLHTRENRLETMLKRALSDTLPADSYSLLNDMNDSCRIEYDYVIKAMESLESLRQGNVVAA